MVVSLLNSLVIAFGIYAESTQAVMAKQGYNFSFFFREIFNRKPDDFIGFTRELNTFFIKYTILIEYTKKHGLFDLEDVLPF